MYLKVFFKPKTDQFSRFLWGRGNIFGCMKKMKNEFQIVCSAKVDYVSLLSIEKMLKILNFSIFLKLIIVFGFFSETKIFKKKTIFDNNGYYVLTHVIIYLYLYLNPLDGIKLQFQKAFELI